MKAVVLYEHGGIDKLVYEDLPNPIPLENEVLVRVKACGINHLDIWVRKGLAGKNIKMPHICGSDIAGDVESGKMRGDKVLVYPGISCLECEYCKNGMETLCSKFAIIGGLNDTQGGYAEYVKVPVDNLIPIPDWLSYEEAASINISHLTAWNMLSKADLKKGSSILVYGAGSGVGSATIQFAKAMGYRVITTASREKVKIAEKLGADLVINRDEKDIVSEVMRFTNGVDAVIDHVGAQTWDISLQTLKTGGKMLVCGATSGDLASINIRNLYNKQHTIIGIYLGTKRQLIDMLKFMEVNRIKPIIDSIIPLSNVREAHERMERSEHYGKIVLRV